MSWASDTRVREAPKCQMSMARWATIVGLDASNYILLLGQGCSEVLEGGQGQPPKQSIEPDYHNHVNGFCCSEVLEEGKGQPPQQSIESQYHNQCDFLSWPRWPQSICLLFYYTHFIWNTWNLFFWKTRWRPQINCLVALLTQWSHFFNYKMLWANS